jgi:[glutamine synthetase] adenylyltransferase / [glutamine synthetase]-adenylyl-L-tyrosine phosphorylase
MNDHTDQALLTEPQAARLLQPGGMPDEDAVALLRSVGFDDCDTARRRLLELARNDDERVELAECFPMLLVALSDAATPDGSLVNFERFVQSVDDRGELFHYLAEHPRAVEILIKLFVGSQFLTEILLRRPSALDELTNHKGLAEFKSRPQIIAEAAAAAAEFRTLAEKLDALRRFQHWELLRIGACDSFGLLDLKSVTVQLSLLADGMVQSCLDLVTADMKIDPAGFVVLAFGKLGGEELNYSSDIDLVFLAPADSSRFWKLGQKLIQALLDATGEGFLYRVDMRLRPWGRSGALVNTVKAHIDYLAKHGRAWEKQALLKARPIAGDYAVGEEFLKRAEPLIFSTPPDAVRENIREMKARIEADLEKQGRVWGEVKSGEGSIRDVEFVTQCLQLIHGRDNPHVRSFNTMDGLVRLADFGYLHADEYRHLSSGYSFLRTVEHSLQLMHHKQTHTLPGRPRELAYLARRLDFPSAEQFVGHYERHCEAIRRIFAKYILLDERAVAGDSNAKADLPDHRALMEPTYVDTFNEEQIGRHAKLLDGLSAENLVEVDAALADGRWDVTIVGYDHIGELSLMCGLLFVYGFDIVEGNIFTAEHVAGGHPFRDQHAARRDAELESARKFVNVFSVRPPADGVDAEVWNKYKSDLIDLVQLVREGGTAQAHGKLAKRVAAALRDVPGDAAVLLPVAVEIDNDASERMTVLHIRADDTIGFLYELTNALAMSGIEIERVIVRSVGNRVADTLFVTGAAGEKIIDDDRLRELRAAVVLIKHFTHLLPRSPNPEQALLHFREFIEQLFQTDNWIDDLSSLERPAVLHALAKLLGVSNFLWEDFLRLQHDNLFPVVKDVEGLRKEKSKADLAAELDAELRDAANFEQRTDVLNAFKDREMFRIDMRHILGHVSEFGEFAGELSDLADVVVAAAVRLCDAELRARYGTPMCNVAEAASFCPGAGSVDDMAKAPGFRLEAGSFGHVANRECALSVCALGKCGGREMGFASDVELMFVYEGSGRTTGPEVITTTEYFLKLVESFTQTIRARQEGIFQIDLRLRPYGKAGSLAVSLEAFQSYFAKDGAAWPYERQALVKLRPVAGNAEFGVRIAALRDELLFTGEPFDAVAMRAMREKQIRQLVQAGTFNAKLSPGGLVDCEYLVQGLQITHGHRDPALRSGRTRDAIAALRAHGILSDEQHRRLLGAYMFLRRLIDALRMVRGNARDLTVPTQDDEEFQFLARRLGYGNDVSRLQSEIASHTEHVRDLTELLDAAAS